MNGVAQVLAVLVGVTLVVMFVLEVFFHGRRALYPIFLIRPADVPAVRMWAVNVGCYNLCYGIGALVGVAMLQWQMLTSGVALVLFTCASHVFRAGAVPQRAPAVASALGESLPALASWCCAGGLTRSDPPSAPSGTQPGSAAGGDRREPSTSPGAGLIGDERQP